MKDREAKIEALRYLNDMHGVTLLVIAKINGEKRKVLIGENAGVNPLDGGLFVADGEEHEMYPLDIEREVEAVVVLSSADDFAEIQRQIAEMKMPE
ncbi:MAG TPA: hypothetical protein DIT25_03705 [Candidatus Moranbacteria bacterium]|nr:hypothetical protein [Candidatus Moranbacteria bacterium]